MSDTPDNNQLQPFAPVRGFSDLLGSSGAMASAWRLAQVLANSGIVPKHFAKQPEACMVALVQAVELGENPLVLMSNMHVVHGSPGFAAKYMIARLNSSGKTVGPVRYNETGEPGMKDYAVTAYATDKDTGEVVSFTVTWTMAVAEGWTSNTKYKSMPQVMMRYRAATFLVRMYYPEVMLGYSTVEELETLPPEPVTAAARPVTARSALGLSDPTPALPDHGEQPDPLAGVRPQEREAVPVQSEVVEQPRQTRKPPTPADVGKAESAVLASGGTAAVHAARDTAGIDYEIPVDELSQEQLVSYRAALATV